MLPNTPMPKSIRDVLRPGGLCPVRVQWSVKIIVILLCAASSPCTLKGAGEPFTICFLSFLAQQYDNPVDLDGGNQLL